MKKRITIILTLFIISFFIYSCAKMNQDDPNVIKPLLQEVESYIPQRDKKNLEISKVDVAWQLDHILKTINRITEALEASDPNYYSFSVNLGRTLSLTKGYIPRGRAQSPDVVKPPEVIITEDIYEQLEEARTNISKLIKLDKHSNFEHPYFGQLKKSQAVRFIEVHTKHHLNIVKDILEVNYSE